MVLATVVNADARKPLTQPMALPTLGHAGTLTDHGTLLCRGCGREITKAEWLEGCCPGGRDEQGE